MLAAQGCVTRGGTPGGACALPGPQGRVSPRVAPAHRVPRPAAHLGHQVECLVGARRAAAHLVGVGGQRQRALGAPDRRLVRILGHAQDFVVVAGLGAGGREGLVGCVDACSEQGQQGLSPCAQSASGAHAGARAAARQPGPAARQSRRRRTCRMRDTASGAPLGTSFRRWRMLPPAAPCAAPCAPPPCCCRCCRWPAPGASRAYCRTRASQPMAAAPTSTPHQVQPPVSMPQAGLHRERGQGRKGCAMGWGCIAVRSPLHACKPCQGVQADGAANRRLRRCSPAARAAQPTHVPPPPAHLAISSGAGTARMWLASSSWARGQRPAVTMAARSQPSSSTVCATAHQPPPESHLRGLVGGAAAHD